MFFSTVHHSIELLHQPTLMLSFLYSLTICLLHYYPRHVSNINMPIFRRKNCIQTASGTFALCNRLHSTLVDSGLINIILDMFRTLTCPSSGEKIVFTQHLLSSLSVIACTVHWLRADSLTICLLHYYPRHVSNINMSIFRRKNCIHTAFVIFALCNRLHSTLVESGLINNMFITLLSSTCFEH